MKQWSLLCPYCRLLTTLHDITEQSCEGRSMLQKARHELIDIARQEEPSVLKNRSYTGLCEENWMEEVSC